jgi:hypothetical protein
MINLTEKRIANISLKEAPILTGPRNLELAWKTTSERNRRSTIRTRDKILELDENKKKKDYNQEKDRRNITSIEMII